MTDNTKIIRLTDRFASESGQALQATRNGLPKCPEYLTPLAQKHWPELVESLGHHGIINELDRDVLGVYCSLIARFIELDEKLDEVGMTQMTKSGYEAETGTFTAWNKLIKPIMAYAKQLGLTPPARIAMQSKDPAQSELNF